MKQRILKIKLGSKDKEIFKIILRQVHFVEAIWSISSPLLCNELIVLITSLKKTPPIRSCLIVSLLQCILTTGLLQILQSAHTTTTTTTTTTKFRVYKKSNNSSKLLMKNHAMEIQDWNCFAT
jgi:hypothetical protein